MRKNRTAPRGQLESLTIDSRVLRDNLLGDPHERRVDLYIPAGHDGRGLPLLVDLVGFTAGGPAHTNWKNFGENVPERADRLIAEGKLPPVVIAFPDCFTRLGGNQYINSAAMGRWEDFLIDEMLPAVEGRLGCGGPGRRGVFGKSSGGYGSIIHAMRRADTWSAAACHSGDMAFELAYLLEMPNVLRALAKHEGSIERFITALEEAKKIQDADLHILMWLAMAATYDPDPSQFLGIRLPVNPDTCELIEERWANWLEWDPALLADRHADALKSLKALYIDCGDIDQFNLVYGARRLHRSLERLGVTHRYEEFPDNHSSVDYRMDESLPYLARALTGG
ncbi:alpha/beta hydrolase [Inquilinus sp. OTU3971]|uniref:alpha/beta hydrolase n=1 Tax=Inquilinus sp. OTU3971 TaxID=3043855 RepID=UPI00313DE690